MTGPLCSIVRRSGGAVDEGNEGKRELLVEEMQRYFGETCPVLAARCQRVIRTTPAFVWEIAAHTRDLGLITDDTNRQLRAALVAIAKGRASVDASSIARASLKHLNELALELSRRLDQILNT